MLQTWAILGNFKSAFWLVAHILHDPTLAEVIADEVWPAVALETQGIKIDHHYLSESCPKLDSLYSEVLWLTMTSPMVRDVVSTTIIGGQQLREENKVLVCIPFTPSQQSNNITLDVIVKVLYRQLLLDRATWLLKISSPNASPEQLAQVQHYLSAVESRQRCMPRHISSQESHLYARCVFVRSI
ncbi:hypothetical protein BDV12DRAFT_193251 [Aspergillus spectabilis]